MQKDNEFYIGWQAKAPLVFKKHIKKVLIVLFPIALLAGFLLGSSQKKFSTAQFEFGKPTSLKGIYYSEPVPLLKVTDKNNTSIFIPLVGYGKHGAATTILEWEKENSISLNRRQLTLTGTLLYNDGKVLMQVDKNSRPVLEAGTAIANPLVQKNLGRQTIRGEIIDPKCYFGVMKPGEGKVHRDCAIRCILGGIPPVLHVQNEKGEHHYYLLAAESNQGINEAVQDRVAEPVTIEGRLVQQDDWMIVYTSKENIQRYSYINDKYKGSIAHCFTTGK
jgi:hypothetical protein